jgi:hypothetical protein
MDSDKPKKRDEEKEKEKVENTVTEQAFLNITSSDP